MGEANRLMAEVHSGDCGTREWLHAFQKDPQNGMLDATDSQLGGGLCMRIS